MPRGRLGAVAYHAGLLAVFVIVVLAYTWPLVRRLDTDYPVWDPQISEPSADQLLTSWLLAHDARTLLRDPRRVFESNNFHPFRRTLTYQENLLGLAVLVAPVQWIGDNPTLTDNVALLVGLAVGGFGVCLLVRELSGSTLAGVLAGVLATYTPARWFDLSQLQMVAYHWTPIALLALVRLLRTGRWRSSGLLALATAAQIWTSVQWALFVALGLSITAAVLLATSAAARKALPQLAAAVAVAAVLCMPLVRAYALTAWEMDIQERGTVWFMWPAVAWPPLAHPLHYLATRLTSGQREQAVGTLTPWLAVLAGAFAAVVRRRPAGIDGRALFALVAGGVVSYLVALGPVRLFGLPSLYLLLRDHVPGFVVLRAPVRAVNYAYLSLCIAAGCGLAAVLRRLNWRPARALLSAVVVALAVVETGWLPVPLARAPARETPITPAVRSLPADCAIAEIPATFESGALALFRSTAHWRPIVNGYGGFYGIEPFTSYWFLNQFPSRDALAYLEESGACAVVVRWPERMARIALEASRLALPTTFAGEEALIRVPPLPAVASDPQLARDGWRATDASGVAADAVLDGDLETMWQGSTLRAQPDRLTLDLGRFARVSAVELALGHHLRSYLVTYRVEGALDEGTWTTLAEHEVAVPPLGSYRANPYDIRQRIPLPPATVRFLRIGPFRRPPEGGGFDPDADWKSWGVAELRVYGMPARP